MEKYTEAQIEAALKSLDGWSFRSGSIEKSYTFNDFRETFTIMTRIAFECEATNHHPEWSNVYNSLTIRLNTHDANGITKNDFDLAQKIEKIILGK